MSVPKLDYEGNIYDYEYTTKPCPTELKLVDRTPENLEAIRVATQTRAEKAQLHPLLEALSTVKPIGRSDVKVAMVLGILVHDLWEVGASEYVVREVAKSFRLDPETTFFPNHAIFVKRVQDRMKEWENLLIEEKKAPIVIEAPQDSEEIKKWPAMSEEERKDFCDEMRQKFPTGGFFLKVVFRAKGMTDAEIDATAW